MIKKYHLEGYFNNYDIDIDDSFMVNGNQISLADLKAIEYMPL